MKVPSEILKMHHGVELEQTLEGVKADPNIPSESLEASQHISMLWKRNICSTNEVDIIEVTMLITDTKKKYKEKMYYHTICCC